MSNSDAATPPVVWTIAGSDSGGGAGLQADLHTLQDFNVHGCSVVTAITAQNSQEVTQVQAVSAELVTAQLDALASDMPARVIKTGMLASAGAVQALLDYLPKHQGLLICDPVVTASTGKALLEAQAKALMIEQLLPHVDVLTPNIPELELLLGVEIDSEHAMEQAAQQILAKGCKAVLIKGGHAHWQQVMSADYFSNGELSFWMVGERIETANTHGSGCTTASALAACLAQGMDIEDAVVMAKAYVTQGIRLAKPIGSGAGPVSHDGWLNQLQNLPMVYKRFDLAMDAPQFELCDSDQLGLYPVVDSIEWLEQLLPLGVETIQLRVKDVPEAELDIMVAQAVALQKKYGARLFINDYWQLAIKHDAYGVHLGQEDLDDADLNAIAGAGLKLGVSTHSYYEIARAHGIAPSYVAMGPIFPTATKQMRWEQQGIEQLMDWVDLLGDEYPLVAIGGIDYDRAQLVLQTGVGSVAMVSAITKAQDFQMETQRLLALFR